MPEYIHHPSSSFMCFPACLNMILERRGITKVDQKELSRMLGLVVPPSQSQEYPWAGLSDDSADWGVHPQKEGASIDDLITKLKLPLASSYILMSNIPTSSLIEYLEEVLNDNNDIIVGFNYKSLFGDGEDAGHACLVSGVDKIKGLISLLDPDMNVGGQREVTDRDLIRILLLNNNGFWIVSDTDKKIPVPY